MRSPLNYAKNKLIWPVIANVQVPFTPLAKDMGHPVYFKSFSMLNSKTSEINNTPLLSNLLDWDAF